MALTVSTRCLLRLLINTNKSVHTSGQGCCNHVTQVTSMTRKLCSNGSVEISVQPCPAMSDEPVSVKILGLSPYQPITLAAAMTSKAAPFISHAHFVANGKGVVDLSKNSSHGGHYTGVEPMAFIWSMTADEGSRPGTMFIKQNSHIPTDVSLYVLPEHVPIAKTSDIQKHQILRTNTHQRRYVAPDVKRIVVRDGRVRGSLYIPPGRGPFPGVLDMHGVVPGLIDSKPALLASYGFVTMGLAYVGYEDLPKPLEQRLDLEYLQEALEWFLDREEVDPGGIGVMGYSKSCDMATYIATLSDKVKATVLNNGFNFYTNFNHYLNGKQMPTFRDHQKYTISTPEGLSSRDKLPDADIPADCLLPVEQAPWTHYLFVVGEDDHAINPVFSDRMIDRLRQHGLSNYTKRMYSDAGHVIDPPYTPTYRTVYSGWYRAMRVMGGHPRGINAAQQQSWKDIIQFFREKLPHNSAKSCRSL